MRISGLDQAKGEHFFGGFLDKSSMKQKSVLALLGSVFVGAFAAVLNAAGAVSVIQDAGLVPRVTFSAAAIYEVDISWPWPESPLNKSWAKFEVHYHGENLPAGGVPIAVSAWRPRSNEFKSFGISQQEYFRGGSPDEYKSAQSGYGLVGWEFDEPYENFDEIWVCRSQELLSFGPWSFFQNEFSRVVVVPVSAEDYDQLRRLEVAAASREVTMVTDVISKSLGIHKDDVAHFIERNEGGEVNIRGRSIKLEELTNPMKYQFFSGEAQVVSSSFGLTPRDCSKPGLIEQLDLFRA